jgi:ribosomal protein S18 acetylase RimI-like enzyme
MTDATDRAPVVVPASMEDLDAVLPLHQRAFAGSMGVALGRPYLRPFLTSFLEGPDRVFLVARDGSEVVGYVFGKPAESSDDRRLALGVAKGLLRHPGVLRRADVRAELLRRLRRFDQALDEAPGLPLPTIDLVGIGTDPARRGHGLGRALLRAFEGEVVRLGFGSARLSVYRDNAAARRLYEEAGWTSLDHPKPTLLSYVWIPPA